MRLSVIAVLSVAAVAILPFFPRFGLLNGAITAKYFLLIALVDISALFFLAAVSKRKNLTSFLQRPLILAAIGVVIIELAAAVFGVNLGHSFWGGTARMTGIFFLLHIFAYAFILGETLNARGWSYVRRSIILSTGLFALLTIIGTAGLGYSGSFLWLDLGVRGISFGNETFAGNYLILAAVLGCIEYVKTKERLWKALVGISLAIIALSPILLNSAYVFGRTEFANIFSHPQSLLGLTRASSATLLIFLAFLAGWWATTKISVRTLRNNIRIAWAATFLGALIIGSALLITPGSVVQTALSAERITTQRFIVWEATIPAALDRPFLGWGPENFDRVFELHFEPRLYDAKDKVETWFDRAHNVTIDTLTSVGIIGTIAWLYLVAIYIFSIYRAWRRDVLTETEFMLWSALPILHLLQLQTAFNVVPTYVLLAVAGGHALWLETNQGDGAWMSKLSRRVLIAVFSMGAIVSLGVTFLYELPRQVSLTKSLGATDAAERGNSVESGLSRKSDFEGLHRTAGLFTESVYDALPESRDKEQVLTYARPYLAQYLAAYERYLESEPDHYRARINYAYLLLLMQQWGGENRSADALRIVEGSYDLSPNNPMTHVVHVMAYAYAGDLEKARGVLNELKALVPSIQLTIDTDTWLTNQERISPQHSFLRISNI